MNLYYEVHDGNGPYMLMVHGMLSSRAQWMLNVDALKEVCRPVVVELWGHARSSAPNDPSHYRPKYYLEQFEVLRQKIGAEQWLLCGQSMGAGLTWNYALEFPKRIFAHIFTNSASAFADEKTVKRFRDRAIPTADLVDESGAEGLLKIPVHPIHARYMPENAKAAMVEDSKLHTPEGIIHAFFETSPNLSVGDGAGENKIPTLLFCGSKEDRFKVARDWAAKNVPNLTIVDAPVGHASNVQAADSFNEAVKEFVNDHRGGCGDD